LEGLGINLGYLLVQLFNFAIMFIVINAWVVKPILRMLEKRRQIVAQGLEDARVAAEARANAEVEASKIIAEAQQKAAQIVREATERASAVERELKAAAEAEAFKTRQAALEALEEERNQMLADLRSQVASLAIAAAQHLIGESLLQDERRQHALLDEFFSGVKSGKVVVLQQEAELNGNTAEVVSALPLTPDEQETVKREVLTKLGDEAVVQFRVDPKILGGLVVRVGDRMIDGSVAGQLQALRQNLQ
jgi:F-type H+-transporting ATPase subunit b